MLVFTLGFSVPLLGKANSSSDFDTYGVKNYDVVSNQKQEIQTFALSTSPSWSTLPSQNNVDLNKEWTITFSGGTVSLDKIAGIVIERNGVFIPVRVRLFPAANQAIVTPQENYLAGENYTVRVFLENGLRYKMSFTTKAELTSNSKLGNTSGNISNYGLVAEHNGWIYYRNTNDNGYLYKMKSDGSESTLISNHFVSNINVMGGWVYYSTNINSNHYIYKVRVDGTDRIELIDTYNTRYSMDTYNRMLVSDTNIFIENWYNNSPYKIFKTSLDGSLNSDIVHKATFITIYNNTLITRNSDSKLQIYDLNNNKVIFTSSERVSALNLVDNWIYYINNDDYRIYKMYIDGSNKQQLNHDWSTYLNVYGSWIYYVNDEDQTIYRMKTDGTSRQQLMDSKASWINVTSEWIFYTNPDNNKLYKMKHNGANWQEVK